MRTALTIALDALFLAVCFVGVAAITVIAGAPLWTALAAGAVVGYAAVWLLCLKSADPDDGPKATEAAWTAGTMILLAVGYTLFAAVLLSPVAMIVLGVAVWDLTWAEIALAALGAGVAAALAARFAHSKFSDLLTW
jgi:NADH:ubiquinone oxidoreductase subunit 6 (subunit J)